jgi:arsenate reductase
MHEHKFFWIRSFSMIIYGLSTCAICQRARKTLESCGKEVEFRDIRSDPLNEAELAELIMEFGDRLVDRSSSDFRMLNDWLKNSEVEAQIVAKPKVMTRPVIRDENTFYLGWDDAVQRVLLADQ